MLELRVGALLVFAAYLFSIDTHVLSTFNLSVPHAFGYHTYSRSPLQVANWMLASLVGGSILFGIQRLVLPSLESRIVPLATLSTMIIIILSQRRLFKVLKRIIYGGLSAENRLGDILVSDAFVSLASVFVDIAYSISLTYYNIPASNPVDRPNHIGYKILLVATIPQGIRMKQCIIDYRRTKSRQHLLNLVKYLIGNMPHALRVNISMLNTDIPEEATTRLVLEGLLRKSLFLNAVYSLAWDILVDWRLTRLRDQPSAMRFPRWYYYMAAITDSVLRFTFVMASPIEHVIFSLQALELFRRGMWILFRIESEPIELIDEIELVSS